MFSWIATRTDVALAIIAVTLIVVACLSIGTLGLDSPYVPLIASLLMVLGSAVASVIIIQRVASAFGHKGMGVNLLAMAVGTFAVAPAAFFCCLHVFYQD